MRLRKLLICLLVMACSTLWINTSQAAPLKYSSNGHYYDVIQASLNWAAAKTAAESLSYLGVFGHLATVTSAEENNFIFYTLGQGNLGNHYLGGFQPDNSPEPVGNWQWVTGEAWNFTNWNSGEPNNVGNESKLHYYGLSSGWNDIPSNWIATGYVVEYPVSAPIPEPASLLLLGSGLAGLLGSVKKKLF